MERDDQFRVEVDYDKFIRHGTFQMFHAVARSNQLTLQQKGLYSIIASYAFSVGQKSWPSYDRLAEEAGVSPRYVKQIIKELVEFGVLSKRKRKNASNVYTLVYPDDDLLKKLFPNGYKTMVGEQEFTPVVNYSSPPSEQEFTPAVNYSSPEEKEMNNKETNNIKEEREQQIKELWEYWKKKFEGLFVRATLTDKRKKHINARLNDGFTVDELKRYMDYIRGSEFHVKNGYFYIENIFREPTRVEKALNTIQRQQKPAVNQSNSGGMYQNADDFLDKLFD